MDILTTSKDKLTETIRSTTCFGETYALTRYNAICTAAKDVAISGRTLPSNALWIRLYTKMCREYQAYLDSILEGLHQAAGKLEGTPDCNRISLIQTLHGVGSLSVVILITEMGASDLSPLPKKLYVCFGLNPGVNDPSRFHGDRVHMSKRSSSLARRILHMVAINSLEVDKVTKTSASPVIYGYYTRKCVSRKKSVTTGAVIHRIYNIIFAILRDNRPFELITPEEHREHYAAEHPESINPAV